MKYPLTLADIRNVKVYAKRLKVKFPELPDAKRLHKASVEVVGARSYHELNCNFEKVINQDVDTPDGPYPVSHCLYCDYHFGGTTSLIRKIIGTSMSDLCRSVSN